jgi:polysaccharide export outer membrane protein
MAIRPGGTTDLSAIGCFGFRGAGRFTLTVLALLQLSAQPALAHEQVIFSGDRYQPSGLLTETYTLGGGDKVHVIVFNEPQLTGDFIVDSAGNLSLPLIGPTPVQGMTVGEASNAVEAAYLKDHFLRVPRVSAEVTVYRPFFILGEVRMPGQFAYVAGLTAMSAIATSQGLTPRARKKSIYIRRFGQGSEEAFALTPDLRIWPGDTIRIAERLF